MLIEPLEPIKVRLPDGEIRQLNAGAPVDLAEPYASKLLERAPGKVRPLKASSPVAQSMPSLQPGWLVAYRDTAGRLLGGAEDAANGAISRVDSTASGFV